MKKYKFILTAFFLSFSAALWAQDTLPTSAGKQIFQELIVNIESKAMLFNKKIREQTTLYLNRLEKEESRLKNKLSKKDPALVKSVFENLTGKYAHLRTIKYKPGELNTYLPLLDSLRTSIEFLKSTDLVPSDLSGKFDLLQTSLNHSDALQKHLSAYEQQLVTTFEKLGMIRQLKFFRKQIYYFRQELSSIKNSINNPSLVEQKLLSLLRENQDFQQFFRDHSQLSALFAIPSSEDLIAGLQTKNRVADQLEQLLGSDRGIGLFRQQVQSGQDQLNSLKNKFSSMSSGSIDNGITEIPGFRPNSQKTKTFMNRLEPGTNFQSARARQYFPVTTDIGLSLGYRLNDKSILGVGFSYKMGWGKGWDQLSLSHQGAGLRSFIDWKIRSNLFVSGGYEQNYRASFRHIEELKNGSYWQSSGLIGLSKKYSVSKKIKGEIKLLWDFLSYHQQPATQPILFRIGYQLK